MELKLNSVSLRSKQGQKFTEFSVEISSSCYLKFWHTF